jgi:hypothetical protein
MTGEEMMGGLPLNRLHDAARREVRRDTQQQVHGVRPDVPLQNLDILTPTDLPNQIRTSMPTSPGIYDVVESFAPPRDDI